MKTPYLDEYWDGYREHLLTGRAKSADEINILKGTYAAGVSMVAQLVVTAVMDMPDDPNKLAALAQICQAILNEADTWMMMAAKREHVDESR